MRTRLPLRLALATIGIATLGACATIPERAWSNGRAMSNSTAYRSAMYRQMSASTIRDIQASADPMRYLYQQKPYAPFTQWRDDR